MGKRQQTEMVKVSQMLLCTLGTFFVFTKRHVFVELLSDTETTRFWEGITIAEACVFMDKDVARQQVLRQTFGSDVEDFLPATSRECLMYYVEHYEGRSAEDVKGLCAMILTGTPYGPESHKGFDIHGDGEKITAPVGPTPNTGPSGESFDAPSVTEILAEREIRQIESAQA